MVSFDHLEHLDDGIALRRWQRSDPPFDFPTWWLTLKDEGDEALHAHGQRLRHAAIVRPNLDGQHHLGWVNMRDTSNA